MGVCRLSNAMVLDQRTKWDEMNSIQLKEAEQDWLHDGTPMCEAHLTTQANNALHKAKPEHRTGTAA
jgi:hypothetical protein